MAKAKKVFVCQNCGAQHAQWMGKCSVCHQWNTVVEEVQESPKSTPAWAQARGGQKLSKEKSIKIQEVEFQQQQRIDTQNEELNRVLGGGLVPGSLVLLGGEPGIGKSTLMLQVSLQIKGSRVLYVSGEESPMQIKMRAERIGLKNEECFILSATSIQSIFAEVEEVKPNLLVVDSVQTLHTDNLEAAPGTVGQIRESAAEFLRFAKTTGTPVVLIGHITKEGYIAGPKILEHMVDAVLQFEGDRNHVYRLLRAHKNRFGSTAEIGIYQMQGDGLREVLNPSEILLSQRDEELSGNAVAVMLEGARAMLVEVQALVSTAVYGTPQRSSTGFDTRRLNMLLAVLEKRCGFRLGQKDVFLNITGGIRVDDPAMDLAVVTSILSSSEDIPIHKNVCFAAEVGLSGEVRPITRVEQRITEAEKLGFEVIYVSKYNKAKASNYKIKVIALGRIEEVFSSLFG